MDAFDVSVDMPRRFLALKLRGIWTEVIFDDFAAEFAAALRLLQSRGGCRYALVDGRDFAVQSSAISGRFKTLIDEMAPVAARRTATLVPGQLNRLQAEQAGEAINSRVFTDQGEAIGWLFHADEDLITEI